METLPVASVTAGKAFPAHQTGFLMGLNARIPQEFLQRALARHGLIRQRRHGAVQYLRRNAAMPGQLDIFIAHQEGRPAVRM